MKKIFRILALLALTGILAFSACKTLTHSQFHIDRSSCNGCTNCSSVCPSDAIYFDSTGKAVIDQTKCTQCADCVAVCPQNAIY